MIVLALDTALEACSAAVTDGERVRAVRSEVMTRGHQERLGPLIREVMDDAGVGFPQLGRIGVTVGPGSFTGLRVGLAFAKGLGFALGRPVIGVGTLESLAASTDGERVAAVVDARRGQVWMQMFAGGRPLTAPEALEPDLVEARLSAILGGAPCTLVGSGAVMVSTLPGATRDSRSSPDPVALARLAAGAPEPIGAPRPLYLRAPDAKLPGGRAPGAA